MWGACAAGLALAGCTTGTVEISKPDGTKIDIAFQRAMTAAAVELSGEEFRYSSDPSAAAQQDMVTTLLRALLATTGTGLPAKLESREPR
jgi:hypothetical protein